MNNHGVIAGEFINHTSVGNEAGMKNKQLFGQLNSKFITKVLDPPQQRLWGLLSQIPDRFVLYGGTAIALRLGHRKSIDFDFSSVNTFLPDDLLRQISFLKNSVKIQEKPNAVTLLVTLPDSGPPVKVSFFGNLPLNQVRIPNRAENNILVASLEDLFGMECATVSQRAEKKDYLDIHAIIKMTNLVLSDGLAAAKAIYGIQFNPVLTLKSLAYFQEGNVMELPAPIKRDLISAIKQVEPGKIPSMASVGFLGEIAE